ncbi:hypothetical protein [Streptomyces scabiei]|uniref:hypothetical protein n=1 Tax=Streptomyces scabiei TaxID=1930 RepID=UPI0029AC2440|nr:hypothetical protein [Streptomyces scabiei]MDX3523355.1 hypothetical protein [Streptomyces scabiei]
MNTPNAALAFALATAGWSNHEVARRLNELAAERGHRGIAIDHTRVGRWIRRGEKPRPPVPELLADLLTRRLGYPCTPHSLAITPTRRVYLQLDEPEHTALLHRAAEARLPVPEYLQALLRSALADEKVFPSPLPSG